MTIQETQLSNIATLRTAYLNSLPQFQELFLELMIPEAKAFLLLEAGSPIGYCIVSNETTLLEFYLVDQYLTESHTCFKLILETLGIKEVFCKSFDSLLLNCCLTEGLSCEVAGILYRSYEQPKVATASDIVMKKADLSAIDFLLNQDDSINELFESQQQLTDFIENQQVFEFYRNDIFIGCGMVIKTHQDWEYCDLGVWVEPTNRGHAYGAQIIMSLREFAVKNHLKPSCGCAADNLASQRTIEKSGFVSKHQMLYFTK